MGSDPLIETRSTVQRNGATSVPDNLGNRFGADQFVEIILRRSAYVPGSDPGASVQPPALTLFLDWGSGPLNKKLGLYKGKGTTTVFVVGPELGEGE